MGYGPEGCKELDTTEQLTLAYIFQMHFSFDQTVLLSGPCLMEILVPVAKDLCSMKYYLCSPPPPEGK